ncbi:MAG TPA: SMP-30/gluconolactonase/LRE family protein, partial [Gemmatimonadales bacterium]|nr:SMP-30/gluconolactonase/LRE family protein [Gemmatimonadales bacterium]
MRAYDWYMRVTAIPALILLAGRVAAQETTDVRPALPAAVVDLRTTAGAALVQAQWRYSDVSIVEVSHREPGPDLRASGAPVSTRDIAPKAGAAEFDDSAWKAISPEALEDRRSPGRLAFNWYRTGITLPQRVGDLDVAGSTVVLELVLDDYAEIWVDGRLPLVLGQAGGQLIKGFNTPNRVVLTRDARPGQQIQLAIFGANGPLSSPPVNFIWIRSATLDFYPKGVIGAPDSADGTIVRLDPALDRIVAPDTRLEKLAGGFQFTEGPVWHPDGYLLFSDPNANTIYRWSPEGSVSVFRTKSGYSGFDIGRYRQPGSNGLTLDPAGLLTINEHGNRRVTRLERTGKITVLADRYNGKRLNSPNDLVYRSDGSLYFTDPPFGLPGVFDDPAKELPFSGVYRLKDGELTLLTRELSGPNGIAFSP